MPPPHTFHFTSIHPMHFILPASTSCISYSLLSPKSCRSYSLSPHGVFHRAFAHLRSVSFLLLLASTRGSRHSSLLWVLTFSFLFLFHLNPLSPCISRCLQCSHMPISAFHNHLHYHNILFTSCNFHFVSFPPSSSVLPNVSRPMPSMLTIIVTQYLIQICLLSPHALHTRFYYPVPVIPDAVKTQSRSQLVHLSVPAALQ